MNTTGWEMETQKDLRDGCLWEEEEVGKKSEAVGKRSSYQTNFSLR